MKKKSLIKALNHFNDEDELVIGEMACSYIPEIKVVCGKRQKHMPYFCVLNPEHKGKCYCANKNADFIPD